MRSLNPSRTGAWAVGLFLMAGSVVGLTPVAVLPMGPCMAECTGMLLATAQPCSVATTVCGKQERDSRDPSGGLLPTASFHASTGPRAPILRPAERIPSQSAPTDGVGLESRAAPPIGLTTPLETSGPSQDVEGHHSRPATTPSSLLLSRDYQFITASQNSIGSPDPLGRPRTPGVVHRSARDRILATIEEHPGFTFSDLKRHLGLASGTITRHLRTLESRGTLNSVRIGTHRRYYVGGSDGDSPSFRLEPTQARIVDLLRSSPGASQADLALRLELPRQNVHYAVRRLVELGIVCFGPPLGARRPCFLSREASRSILFPFAGRKR